MRQVQEMWGEGEIRNGESWVFRGKRRIASETHFAPGSEALGLHLCHTLEKEPFVFPEGITWDRASAFWEFLPLSQESHRKPV